MANTFSDLITNALSELGVINAGEPTSGENMQFCANKCNRMLDQWNARGIAAYNRAFNTFTLTPNHSPHLIGPGLTSPDFAMAVRPVKIYGAAIVLNISTPNISIPIPVRDDDWWHNQRVKTLTSSVPTDLYYSPDFVNGSLYPWPVPTFAYGLELETRTALAQLALGDSISLPPGYEEAITLSLAEALISSFPAQGRDDSQLRLNARNARAIAFAANTAAPRMSTRDGGLGSDQSSGFNWITGR